MKKKGILLLNLGSPDSPSVRDVRSYLTQFLNDPYVIDINWFSRSLLVNLIIVPFRAKESAKIYQQLWTKDGSPLIIYSKEVKQKLQIALGEEYEVNLAMRYKNPSMDSVIKQMETKNYSEITVIPLYPQYATSSTKTCIEKATKLFKKWDNVPPIKYVEHFYNKPLFIDAIIEQTKKHDIKEYDHILFSYHGLPTRQLNKIHKNLPCENFNCTQEITTENAYCYQAHCYETTRLIVNKLGLKPDNYSVGFQSRLDDKWIKPYSDKLIEQFGKEGKKKVLVLSPAFVADCLETTIEIGVEYQEIFEEYGGEKIQLVDSLNSTPKWIETLQDLIYTT